MTPVSSRMSERFAGFWAGWIDLRHGRAIQVGAGLRARAICWKMLVSGQARGEGDADTAGGFDNQLQP